MPKYRVVDGHKKFNGRVCAPGDEIECSAEIAKTLRLKPVEDDKAPAELTAMTVAQLSAEIAKYQQVEELKGLKKAELVEVLKAHRAAAGAKG